MNFSDDDRAYLEAYGRALSEQDDPKIPVGAKVQFKDLITGELRDSFGTVDKNDSTVLHGKPYEIIHDEGDRIYSMRAVLVEVVECELFIE